MCEFFEGAAISHYVIGDIQGCYSPLRRLLDLVQFNPQHDQLYLAGDLVNRGPQSLEVMRFLYGLGTAAQGVLGNHDLHWLLLSEGFNQSGRGDTLDALLRAPDAPELLAWLRHWPLCCDISLPGITPRRLLVHAGLLPQWTADAALSLSKEVEQALNAPHYRQFFAHLWGSEPSMWQDELKGWDRLRVIVNAMTRMRFVHPEDGRMEFRAPGSKGGLAGAPVGCVPWFDVPMRKSANYQVVCGHWSALGLLQRPDVLALDTGCFWGGMLTAVRLEDGRIFQQTCESP